VLHFAAREGDLESTRLLLDAGVNIDIRSTPESLTSTSLMHFLRARAYHLAARAARTRCTECPRSPSAPRSTPLPVAAVRGHVALALFLLETARIPMCRMRASVLHWAAAPGKAGFEPGLRVQRSDERDPTREAKLQLVKALLAHGKTERTDVAAAAGFAGGADAAGATPFLLASAAADPEMMRRRCLPAPIRQATDTKATPVMAASGLNRGIGGARSTSRRRSPPFT
jgi:ankyrin repeat protein